MKKYELVNYNEDTGLYQIKALCDFSDVKAGELGGWVAGEDNLSHEGDCWVYSNARVCAYAAVFGSARVGGTARVGGNARVFDEARVSGSARVGGSARVSGRAAVFGDDVVTQDIINIVGLPCHKITITDNHVNIGCQQHTIEHWIKDYREIGQKNRYSEREIMLYGNLLHALYATKIDQTIKRRVKRG